jgi:hypothetical protein
MESSMLFVNPVLIKAVCLIICFYGSPIPCHFPGDSMSGAHKAKLGLKS